jgi:small-conductance mechanosensitive channel
MTAWLVGAVLAAGHVPVLAAQNLPSTQAPPPSAQAPAVSQRDTAALVIHNQPIVVFRTSLGALTPAERVEAATRRIRLLVEADSTEPVTTRPIAEGTLIVVAGRSVFTLTRADVDTIIGEQFPDVVSRTVTRLQDALTAERTERSLPQLLRGVGLSLLATFLFIAILRGLRWVRRRASDKLMSTAAGHMKDFRIRGFTIFSAESALLLLRRAVDILIWGAGLFAAYLWLAFILTRFAYSRPWGEALGGYLTSTIGALALGAISAIPGIFTVVIILIFVRWLSRVVSAFFDAVEIGTVQVPWPHPETASATKRIVVVLLWLFAIVVAYPYVPGSGSDVFKGVSVFAGLVISLGSSGIVSQAMSGLVLMYSRALKPGDYVRLGEIEGTVSALGMLSTKIRTTKREEVTLPNAVVVGASVKNYSRGADAGLLLFTSVTIGYDTPWRQVEGLLQLAASRTEGLRQDPKPFVLKTALSDFYIEYQLNAVVEQPEARILVLDRLHANIVDAFNEFGVQITSPHYIADPPTPFVVPREKWNLPPAGGMQDAKQPE